MMGHAVAKSNNDIYNTFTVPCEKSKMVSFPSSIMENIIALSFTIWLSTFKLIRFHVNLICCIAFLNLHQVLVVYLNLLRSF